ncbi:Glycosyltransferase involved in cell wall bisynthesis [Peptostreptococcaceae bacterium pGA-8]|nr:Glycosyltransferase involved in cell wall bisynthesis [Peptostreptococcaceae bacterium pGA-8]
MSAKVCHLTSAHDSNDIRIFQKECVSIAENNKFKVYLIAPGESRVEKCVTVIGIGDKPTNRLKRMTLFTRKLYKKAVELDADIYHFHDPELLSVGYKLKKMGKSVIFDSHEFTYEQIKIKTYIPKLFRYAIANLFYKKETKICRELDAVIFPCKVDGKNPFEGRCKKTVFINNLPKFNEFSNDENDNLKKEYDICHIGSLTAERGITEMLEASKRGGFSVILGGEFSSEEYRSSLEAKGLLENVNFVGYCSREDVVEYLKRSKIGISTIHRVGQYPLIENLPTKVYEYMAMSIPVIISDFEYPKRLLAKYKFGISVDPSNAFEIYEAMKTLVRDTDMRLKMGHEGNKAIKEELSWEKEIEKLHALYEELCE